MTSTPPPTDAAARTAAAANMNLSMIDRLFSQPPAPLTDGALGLRVLQTVGRTTGTIRNTPVGVLQRAGRRYLVCPDRTRDWPRNLLASATCVVAAGSERMQYRTVPVEGSEAIETIRLYLASTKAPWVIQAFGVGEDPDPQELRQALPRMAVFRLEATAAG